MPSVFPTTDMPSVIPTDLPTPTDSVFVSMTAILSQDASILTFTFNKSTSAPEDCELLFDHYESGYIQISRCTWIRSMELRVYLDWDCTFQIGDVVGFHHASLTVDG